MSVRALHDFDPVSGNTTCLSFKTGQVIRVLFRDSSGWWDGEISGRRGWFPSNYTEPLSPVSPPAPMASAVDTESQFSDAVEPHEQQQQQQQSQDHNKRNSSENKNGGSHARSYSPPLSPISPTTTSTPVNGTSSAQTAATNSTAPTAPNYKILAPIVHSLTLLQGAVSSSRIAHFQPCCACVISSIRSVLERMDCLTKQSPILTNYPRLAVERKTILLQLSRLVDQTRKASGFLDNEAERQVEAQIMLSLAAAVYSDVQRFLAVALSCGLTPDEIFSSRHSTEGSNLKLAMPTTMMRTQSEVAHAPTSSSGERRSNRRFSQDDANKINSISNSNFVPNFHTIPPQQRKESISSSVTSTSSGYMIGQSTKRSSLTSVISYKEQSISEELSTAHDTILSTIAAFIGHVHSHTISSHSSSTVTLIELTRATVFAVRALLHLVETILRRNSEASALEKAKERLYMATTSLVTSSRIVIGSEDEDEGEDEKRRLLQAATSVHRAGVECVAGVKEILADLSPDDIALLSTGGDERVVRRSQNVDSISSTGYDTQSDTETELEDEMEDRPRRNSQVSTIPVSITEVEEDKTLRFGTTQTAEPKQNSNPDLLTAPHNQNIPQRPPPSPTGRGRSATLSNTPSMERLSNSAPPDSDLYPASQYELDPTSKQSSLANKRGQFPLSIIRPQLRPRSNSSPLAERESSPCSDSESVDSDMWMYDDTKEIAKNTVFSAEGILTGATLPILITHMTPHSVIPDMNFINAFLLTFRLFCSPAELVDCLLTRYDIEMPQGPGRVRTEKERHSWQEKKLKVVRVRVANIFKLWLDQNFTASSDMAVLPRIQSFLQTKLSQHQAVTAQRLLRTANVLEQTQGYVSSPLLQTHGFSALPMDPQSVILAAYPNHPQLSPPPNVSDSLLKKLRSSPLALFSVTDIEPLELARQFTVIESKLYCNIKAEELLVQKGRGLKALSTLGNQITGWIAEMILEAKEAKRRSALVKYFIKVADKCLSLLNLSTVMAIISALNASTITRLKKTWDGISLKTKQTLSRLSKVVDSNRNYAEYRSILKYAAPPALPFIGFHLTDLTFIVDGNRDTRLSSAGVALINFDKFSKLHIAVANLQRFQIPFNLHEVEEIQNFLRLSLNGISVGSITGQAAADALWRRSLMIEPKSVSSTPAQTALSPQSSTFSTFSAVQSPAIPSLPSTSSTSPNTSAPASNRTSGTANAADVLFGWSSSRANS